MIKVLFFGQLKEQLGVAHTAVSVAHDMTVAQLLVKIIEAQPHWAQDLNHKTILVAVDHVMAQSDTLVSASSEVAFFPPVTGG